MKPQRAILYDTSGIPFQQRFMESVKPKCYLSTGFGGGKTFTLVMKMFQLMDVNRGLPGGLLCPTTKMYKRDVLPTIKGICRENGIRYKYNKSDMCWYFPDSKSHVYVFHSEDDGDSIKGPNLAWFVINEVTLCTEMAFKVALSRVRLKSAKRLQIAMSGTPEGFNWNYEYFVENPREDTDLIFGDSRLNTHVAESYFGTLMESYDPLMQKQYIGGEFINMKGKRAAWMFNRFKHTAEGINKVPGAPVLISLDFNVSPMAATLWNPVPIGDASNRGPTGTMLRGFDEICIESSNTYEMCDAIKEKLDPGDEVTIFPDPAGRARSTKTRNTSDMDILQAAGFTDMKYKNVLSVKDCLVALNNMYWKDAIVLNSKKCRHTIADMEQCVLKGNVFEIDKSNEKRTHWLDGTKNMIDYLFPVKRKPAFREERAR